MTRLATALHRWPELSVHWTPSTVNVWRSEEGELELGLNHFDITPPDAPPEKERNVAAQLTRLWFYMLTGQSSESFYSLVGRDLASVPEFRNHEALISCFDALCEFDPAYRATKLDDVLELLGRVRNSLAEMPPQAELSAIPDIDVLLSGADVPDEYAATGGTAAPSRLGKRPDEKALKPAFSRWNPSVAKPVDENLVEPILEVLKKGSVADAVFEPQSQGAVTLEKVIEASGGLNLTDTLAIAGKLDIALQEAEQRGVRNASLHPSDILLVPCVCVQLFEKMTAGMYLGEIAANCLQELVEAGEIWESADRFGLR